MFIRFVIAALASMLTMPALQAQTTSKVADEFELESDYESLFNGKDLSGWNILPTTDQQKKQRARWQKNNPDAPPWPIYTETIDLAGKTKTDDGRFVVEDGHLVVTVPKEGRRVQMLYTQREFENDFTLKLEFRASENADSGVFIKGKQLQCRDYPNAGPYKNLKKFKPGDWNELVVVAKGETAHCTCNGEVLEAEFTIPAKGPIGVEGDRGQLEFRRIRIGPVTDSKTVSDGKLKPTNEVSSWSFELTGNGKGAIKEDGDAIKFTTTQLGEENWHVQAYQAGLALEEGARYTVSFEIKSPDTTLLLLIGQINQEDWHEIGLHEEVYVGEDFKKKEYTFTATDVDQDSNNRIGFILGENEGSVSLRNLTLTKK